MSNYDDYPGTDTDDYDYPGHPDDDHDDVGICMNCGAEMDYSPMHPWCSDCDEEELDNLDSYHEQMEYIETMDYLDSLADD